MVVDLPLQVDVQNQAWIADVVVICGIIALENHSFLKLVQADVRIDLVLVIRHPLKFHLK